MDQTIKTISQAKNQKAKYKMIQNESYSKDIQ